MDFRWINGLLDWLVVEGLIVVCIVLKEVLFVFVVVRVMVNFKFVGVVGDENIGWYGVRFNMVVK